MNKDFERLLELFSSHRLTYEGSKEYEYLVGKISLMLDEIDYPTYYHIRGRE